MLFNFFCYYSKILVSETNHLRWRADCARVISEFERKLFWQFLFIIIFWLISVVFCFMMVVIFSCDPMLGTSSKWLLVLRVLLMLYLLAEYAMRTVCIRVHPAFRTWKSL